MKKTIFDNSVLGLGERDRFESWASHPSFQALIAEQKIPLQRREISLLAGNRNSSKLAWWMQELNGGKENTQRCLLEMEQNCLSFQIRQIE
ncbi:hypothetical protein TNCT_871 [Trichonephila clavata]|uniref:Uncharacterized protein n=1 Tax=Trichonephila clavata TaxID=2740835 RepID=A0A8X6FZ15_TRICU|nr:hypothetical protein TNCT_871 [Trichonephila clavata]